MGCTGKRPRKPKEGWRFIVLVKRRRGRLIDDARVGAFGDVHSVWKDIKRAGSFVRPSLSLLDCLPIPLLTSFVLSFCIRLPRLPRDRPYGVDGSWVFRVTTFHLERLRSLHSLDDTNKDEGGILFCGIQLENGIK